MSRSILMAAGLLLAVGAGCSVDQGRDVEEYRDLVTAAEPPPMLAENSALSLTLALRLAAYDNERLGIEGENLIQALAEKQRAAAALLPTLDLFGNFTARENVGTGGTDGNGNTSSNARNSIFDGGLRAQYSLMSGMSDLASLQSLEATVEQRRWLVLDLRETLLLETARAYYSVAAAEGLVNVIESSASVQAERLREVRGRQQVGLARPLDVAQVESQAAATEVSLLNARNALMNARSALSLLTAAPASDFEITDELVIPTERWDQDSLKQEIELGLANRQDVIAADAAVRASRERVNAAIGRYYPSITVNLEYFLTRQSVPSDREWTSLLTFNLPLFSAGRIDAEVRGAWSQFRQDLLRLSLTRRQVVVDARVAHEDLRSSSLRVPELERQVSAATEALRQAEASYSAGLGTNLERIAAQDALLAAQIALTQERFTMKVAWLALQRSMGMLTPATIEGAPPAPPARYAGAVLPDSPFVRTPGLIDARTAPRSRRQGANLRE